MATTQLSPQAAASAADPAFTVTDSERRRALFGSAVGSTIEWYDYFLYGTMSAIVFGNWFMFFVIAILGSVILTHLAPEERKPPPEISR